MINISTLSPIFILIVIGVIIFSVIKWYNNIPIFSNFQSSTIWKAFVLNSIASSIIIFIALTVKQNFDTTSDNKLIRKTNLYSIFLTLSFTFMSSMLAYTLMYVFFGFGGGMLITKP
uniref:Uncharacterized protein n=1 Tax=viral metagenome TaxID=1070528 RepID=A0A6C0LXT5_9ZZZZ